MTRLQHNQTVIGKLYWLEDRSDYQRIPSPKLVRVLAHDGWVNKTKVQFTVLDVLANEVEQPHTLYSSLEEVHPLWFENQRQALRDDIARKTRELAILEALQVD
jgi:hypothetical protein